VKSSRFALLLLLAACLAAPFASAATTARATPPKSTMDSQVDRLMALFNVRGMAQAAVDSVITDPRFDALPVTQQACLRRVFAADTLVALMRTHYVTLFADARIRADLIAFLESRAGKALVNDVVSAPSNDSADAAMARLGPQTAAEIDRFMATPAGQLLQDLPTKLEPLQRASASRLFEQANSECGPPRG
jgi:hypothetical protein